MKTNRAILIVILLSLSLSCIGCAAQLSRVSPEDVGMSSEKLADVKPVVQALVDDEKVAGATVIVARKGKIAFFETFGMMDREAGKNMAPDTIMRFYSMSKPVTSVAAMILYEQGGFDLDDPVSKYLPQFRNLKVYAESGSEDLNRPVTIRDLMRHTSGLTYGFFGNTPVDKMYVEKAVFTWQTNLEEMTDKLADIPLLYQPGTRWHYGLSTDVLGYLIETVSGQSLDEFFEERIFKPLGMKDTAFYVPAEKVERFAVCYRPALLGGLAIMDSARESRYLKKPSMLSGGGGLVSTGPDYLRLCQMLLNKGKLDGKRILKTQSVEMMTKNQLPPGVNRGPGQGFGFGFSVQTEDGQRPKSEYGWGGMASTHFWISPDDELVVIALSQRNPYSGQLEDALKPMIYDAIID
ncbi:MAG: beta-lactamase family protein [Sedimentisphaerales bacterium]|nr:beta-lactamase family protein [Sedimentisphaerales bacterium]